MIFFRDSRKKIELTKRKSKEETNGTSLHGRQERAILMSATILNVPVKHDTVQMTRTSRGF